jgi:Family of unknown function (DUF6516)
MPDEEVRRLLDFHRRLYWLVDGWSIRFRIVEVEESATRPHGLKYSFTLHDVDGTRLLGFDNAHGLARTLVYDHRHRFRRAAELVPYEFKSADKLICDFFEAVENACKQEGLAFEFDTEEVELETEMEDDDDAKITE